MVGLKCIYLFFFFLIDFVRFVYGPLDDQDSTSQTVNPKYGNATLS